MIRKIILLTLIINCVYAQLPRYGVMDKLKIRDSLITKYSKADTIIFSNGTKQWTAGGVSIDTARASWKADTAKVSWKADTAKVSGIADSVKLNILRRPFMFKFGNNRTTDAFYVTNDPSITSTVPHAIGVFDRLGLSSYSQTDHIGGVRASMTTTNTNKSYTRNYGVWGYSQTQTGTTATGAEFSGVYGQVLHKSSAKMGNAYPLWGRFSFLDNGSSLDTLKMLNLDLEGGSNRSADYFSWIEAGKGESILSSSGTKYFINYTGRYPSKFGGNIQTDSSISAVNLTLSGDINASGNATVSGAVNVDTVIGSTASGGVLTLRGTTHATKGNIRFTDANYVEFYGSGANAPVLRTYETRQLGNWSTIGGLQMWGKRSDGTNVMYGQVYGTAVDTSASNNYGSIQMTILTPAGQRGVLNIYNGNNTRQTMYELYANGIVPSRIISAQYTNDRGGYFRLDTRTGSGTMPQAMLIDSLQNVLIGSSGVPDSNLTVKNGMSVGSSKFRVNRSGNITRINDVPYSFPASQGALNSYLKNDGSGNLTWATITGTSAKNILFYEYREVLSAGDSLTFTIPTVSGYSYNGFILNGWQADSMGIGSLGWKKSGNNIIIKSNFIGDEGSRVCFTIIYKED